jgi:MFS family permease
MNNGLTKGLMIVSIASLFYLFMFFIRVLPTVMVTDLQRDLHITAKGIGLITSSFVIPYAMVQIPSGILIDRLGAKKIMVIGTIGSMLGCILFQYADSYELPTLARALMGVSCGAAFIAPMTLVKQWLPERMFSTAAGMIQLLGCIGAMLSIPLSYVVAEIGWRDTFTLSALVAAVLTGLFLLAVKEKPRSRLFEDTNIMSNLSLIFKDSRYWHVGIIGMASWAIVGGFSESLGISFLSTLQNISTPEAASQMSWVWIGVAIASPLAGYWYEHASNKRLPLLTLFSLSLLSFMLVISGYITNTYLIQLLLLLTGFSAGAQPIAFGLIAHIAPQRIMATAVSFCNTCVIAGAFIMQPIVSLLVDYNPLKNPIISSDTTQSTQYLISDYQVGFTPIIIVVILGLIVSTRNKWN